MKETFFTFVLFDNLNNIAKESFEELFNTFDIKYEFSNSRLIIHGDLFDDLKESIKSLLQDIDEQIYAFEGFRVRNIKDIDVINENFKKYHFNNYMKISDLLLKTNEQETNKLKNIVISRIKEDDYLRQIIFAMFENNLNVSKTASSVYMHRNSVNNKLELIEKETGLNIQLFNEAVTMYNLLRK